MVLELPASNSSLIFFLNYLYYSIKTALVKVNKDSYAAKPNGSMSLHRLPDLSAAWTQCNHSLLPEKRVLTSGYSSVFWLYTCSACTPQSSFLVPISLKRLMFKDSKVLFSPLFHVLFCPSDPSIVFSIPMRLNVLIHSSLHSPTPCYS